MSLCDSVMCLATEQLFFFSPLFVLLQVKRKKKSISGMMLLEFSFSLENLVCATLFMIAPLPAFHI